MKMSSTIMDLAMPMQVMPSKTANILSCRRPALTA